MSEYKIRGGEPLVGRVTVGGAKNGALPLLFASLVAGGICTFYRVPDIGDIRLTIQILEHMGAVVTRLDRHTLRVDTSRVSMFAAPADITAQLRASTYLLGASLARFGWCPALYTGGCDFGARPLDCHYDVFHALGAVGEREVSAPDGLHGACHTFPYPSVGATINALLAASRIEEACVFHGCATEAHVTALAKFLMVLGVEIEGVGTSSLLVKGKRELGGGSYVVPADDIEAGTYLFAGAACGGDVTVTDVSPLSLTSVTDVLVKMGCDIQMSEDSLRLVRMSPLHGCCVETAPAPGFPTDLHPPLAAALCLSREGGEVRECVWQNRFRYVGELRRMGAQMAVRGDTLMVSPSKLYGECMTATDLRGGAAMVIAALATRGRSCIKEKRILERGYEDMPRKLRALGAHIL